VRKTLTGYKLKELEKPIMSQRIASKVPEKWLFIDTESGAIYGYDKKGWQEPHTKVLESGEIAICNMLKYRHPCLRIRGMVSKDTDPKFICSWCEHWVPGVECSIGKQYKQCKKETGWNLDAKTKSVRRKVNRRKK